jgi:UDP-N-acetylglucosamine--N-acetylmuramyl-(pentapeptide) pyrophosphoryl-undecaprenol N-acetylglucosamine transferase
MKSLSGYAQFEYISKELPDLFALADLAVSRAGANAICELLALHKPNILIPLSAAASRGDQILNANSFQKQGFSYVIEEESLTGSVLSDAIRTVYADRETYRKAMEESGQIDSIGTILSLIEAERK